ncbi:unconventional myosin-Vc [Cylas formicarius]|uniref:unconventional myosin-Vc n=1 Tax=Cylas formicarius TaxID=197179 RepID=UPI0029586125|nr:unconventional myosin-Vc [Cylas formicarius]
MASTYYLLDDAMHVEEQIVQKYEQAHTAVKKSHRAAVIIQRYYRGHAVRQRLEKQRIAAIVLQKHTRGWLVRYHLPDIMQQRYDELCLNYYDRMATKIQALWRGVLARKRVCLKLLLEKKRLTEERLKRFTVPPKSSDSSASHFNRFYIEKILTLLFDRHHLLSTRVAKGIFAQKSKSEISEIEKLLTSMPWKKYKKQYTEIANEYFKRVKCIPYQYSDSRLRHQEDLLRLRAPRENKKQILDVEIEDDFLAKP